MHYLVFSLHRRSWQSTLTRHRQRTYSSLSGNKSLVNFAKQASLITKDPVWGLVSQLKREREDEQIHSALESCNISLLDYVLWKHVVHSPNLNAAISAIEQKQDLAGQLPADVSVNAHQQLPAWVAFSLLCHKVRTAQDAQDGLLRLAFEHSWSLGSKDRPAVLILSTHALAHFDILTPMRKIVKQFLTRAIQFPTFHFNSLLRGLSGFTRSEETANLAVSLLEAMSARGVPLWLETYRSLMRDRFVTLQLTKVLHAKMTHEGVVPTAEHLEAFLRVFSKHGAIQDSQEYLRAIRQYCIEHNLTVPHGPDVHLSGADLSGTTHPANTLYIGSLRHDRVSAFHYLHTLLQLDAARSPRPVTSVPGPLSRHASTKFWSGAKASVDIFDWTTALISAANDNQTSASTLITLFERARERTKQFRPTVVTYTVVLRGLLFRGAFDEALRVWNELLDSDITLDRKALTVGVQVLTRAGHPQDALYLLNSFMDAQRTSPDPASLPDDKDVAPTPHHWVNIIVINEFMASLLRIRRPDVIFQLWDHLEQLYSVLPNEVTLTILLKAAVLATKMDNESVRGTFAHLFHAPTVESSSPIDSIMEKLQSVHPPSVVGIWRDRRAGDVARDLFRSVMYGNWRQLLKVKAPASVVHSKDAEATPFHPLMELAKSFAMPFSTRKDCDADAHSPEKKPYQSYPSIVPTDSTFSAYIQLLGLTGRASEISLALAWMRALQIKPSRKTLSIALVFWAEVSLRGPMFEEWAERRNRRESEYGRLVMWMTEWVGEEAPTEWDVQKALRAVAKMRDSSFGRS
ncbi:hypothetical protein DEU56DRAFT_815783 [Suillus clintonianus]|uniref:uncharacterized protein n=1 Tax=Suillus clintonianus TaxID=1904413 RepID=UPI001B886EC8|nr:uncharacterized protein DEU56DRAFT_815783 [Suillus clintonianus]KAG2130388.1 hypothetical protein DEU56DRAFT_815783 [Suillus clintonianus]